MKSVLKNLKAFTLIEALVVALIVGLLASIAIIKTGSARDQSVSNVGTTLAADINKALQRAVIDSKSRPVSAPAITDDTDGVKTLISELSSFDYFTQTTIERMNTFIDGPNNGYFIFVTAPTNATAYNPIPEVKWSTQSTR